jgi:Protein of unknown function (DUF3886)
MKKKKQPAAKKQNDKPVTLGDMLNEDLMKKLKNTKQELKAAEELKKEAEEQKKREERRLKEKNKSFEELFNESSMNWKDYK